MLTKRIIPIILHKNGQLVKGKKFINDRIVGHALQAAKIHAARGVDELFILDVSATQEGREPNYEMIKQLTSDCFSPVTVGGGINTLEHARKLLASGADKVCLGEVAMHYPELVRKMAAKFGSQAIVVALDTHERYSLSYWIAAARIIQAVEAGEILLQDMTLDGTMEGYNLKLIHEISRAVTIPVVASSGCGSYRDMVNAIELGASGVAAGALFQFTDATPQGAARYLHEHGIEVRLL